MVTTSFSGADVEALRDMATQCAAAAQQLAGIGARTTVILERSLTWHGADAARMRGTWHDEMIPAIDTVAGRLREAGLQLVREAEQQLTASTDGGMPGPSAAASTAAAASDPSPSAGGDTSKPDDAGLKEQLTRLRDVLMQLPTQGMLGRVLAELPHHADLGDVAGALTKVESQASRFEVLGTKTLGTIGTLMNANDLATAIENGDTAGVIEHGIPAMFTALGPEVDGTLGVAWAGGWAVGTEAYDAMQGTRYGDIVQSMTDDAFEQHGALGMLQVPGILGLSAWEYFTEDR